MKRNSCFSPSFALVSVLALVSLAALSATAFLASARLQRQSTRSIMDNTRLEMALDAGCRAALEIIDAGYSTNSYNFISTYWRPNTSDWTNELGYLLVGNVVNNNRTNTRCRFYANFSTATFTNLGTNAADLVNLYTNVDNQGTFQSQIDPFMARMTNFSTSPSGIRECTNIPLLGDSSANRFTSPPVGWVYIKQDVRIAAGQTNTTNVPVARFAFYVQELGGLIDAERMGGSNNRTTGTNPAEISLTNLIAAIPTGLSNPTIASNLSSSNNRPKYLTPGLMIQAAGIATNDLRYVASGLKAWSRAWDRIPSGLGYGRSRNLKTGLNTNLDSSSLTNIYNTIFSNVPGFTNRAGGMNGTNYLYALAANMIDYADTNSSATSITTNGIRITGFDNYPFVTQLFDQFVCTQSGNNPPVITVTTYLQFWNPSSIATSTRNYTLLYNFADMINAVIFTNSTTTITNTIPTPPRLTPLVSTNIQIPSIGANCGYITNISTVASYNLASATSPTGSMTWMNFKNVWINTNAGTVLPAAVLTNSLAIQVSGMDQLRMINGYFRQGLSLTNNERNWLGVVLGLRGQGAGAPGVAGTNRLMADPRMLNYISLQAGVFSYPNVYWGGYPAETTTANLWANPALWPDGTSSTNLTPVRGTTNLPTPSLGPFTIQDPLTLIADPAPCKISNSGSYTNICELGNIFDPMQWAPAAVTTNYANINITEGAAWTSNSIYGGGSTLRIGRPEHSRFAFTNLAGSTVASPNMQMSAAALLDLFCITNRSDEGGKINLNTAPAPVLRALAGGVILSNDPTIGVRAVPPAMAEAFAQGVMRFRARYPFYSPSQLCFIGTDIAWPNTNSWPVNAVFGNRGNIILYPVPGNTNASPVSMNLTAWSDQTAEEWFSKIYSLSCVSSRNYRCYVIAQLWDWKKTNAVGPIARKYYQLFPVENSTASTEDASETSTFDVFSSPY